MSNTTLYFYGTAGINMDLPIFQKKSVQEYI